MNTILISDAEFAEIADRDESHFFDIKQYAVSGSSIQKIAVAFSNADGGEIIIGIKDKKTDLKIEDRWEGITDIEKLNGHLQALSGVGPGLNINYEFIKRMNIPGYALRVTIEKGSQVCVTADNSVYVRQGAQSLPLKDPDRIQQLSFAKGASSFEDIVLPDLVPE